VVSTSSIDSYLIESFYGVPLGLCFSQLLNSGSAVRKGVTQVSEIKLRSRIKAKEMRNSKWYCE
jgi:hypothetical protein